MGENSDFMNLKTIMPKLRYHSRDIRKLIEISLEARKKAYSRHSNFKVGAALQAKCGRIFTGCSVDNASYGLSICAERTAIVKAVCEGYREFKAIAIGSDIKNGFIVPCGACRQFLSEFGSDWDVYMSKPDMTFKTMKVKDLLPDTK